MAGITIGDVAARSGLRPSAIRYYEAEGLLPVAARAHGRRIYDGSVFQRLAVIELAKAAGFNLTEIRGLLSAVGTDHPAATWKQFAKARRAEIDREMRTLALMKRVVRGIAQCNCRTLDDCARAFNIAVAKYVSRRPVRSELSHEAAKPPSLQVAKRRAHAERSEAPTRRR